MEPERIPPDPLPIERDLGGLRRRCRGRRALQVSNHFSLAERKGLRGGQDRSFRVLSRGAPRERLDRLGPLFRLGRFGMDAESRGRESTHGPVVRLRGAPRIVEEASRWELSLVPRTGGGARPLRPGHGVHPRRAPSGHGASLLPVLGISSHWLLRAHRSLRGASGLHVSHRSPAPGGDRSPPRLGPFSFSIGRARARLLRRDLSLRARRSTQAHPPRLGQPLVPVRARRGLELPPLERRLLARPVPRRRTAGRCRRLDALSRLFAKGGRVGDEPPGRPREPGGDRVPDGDSTP